ncbi:hypothetical protein, partial [Salinivibrio socompensis]|uniref:hypothetical protein n=1 Tax=Salinivibrio socompensis TaxID=1510206 RepID=UPI001969AA43
YWCRVPSLLAVRQYVDIFVDTPFSIKRNCNIAGGHEDNSKGDEYNQYHYRLTSEAPESMVRFIPFL